MWFRAELAVGQREEVSRVFVRLRTPPVYLTQLVASVVLAYSGNCLVRNSNVAFCENGSTNPVEAHFYIGRIPLTLVCCCHCCFPSAARKSSTEILCCCQRVRSFTVSAGCAMASSCRDSGSSMARTLPFWHLWDCPFLQNDAGRFSDSPGEFPGKYHDLVSSVLADELLSSQYPVADAQLNFTRLADFPKRLRTLLAEEDAGPR